MNVVKIDVSHLTPPEPMTAILSALAKLEQYHCLEISHRRQPFPLYKKLNKAGWAHRCIEQSEDKFKIYIFKSCDTEQFELFFANHQQGKA